MTQTSSVSASSKVALALLVVLGIFGVLNPFLHKFYIFEPKQLQSIAQSNIAKNLTGRDLVHAIVADLNKQWSGHINLEEKWIFNNAGGAMGAMYVVHASISEYIIIFGSPIGTIGHTGRYLVDDYFIILEGEQWAFSEGQMTREVYKPGDMHHLVRGTSQAYRIPDHCWALEYARGWIPLMLPFGVVEVFTSTLDFVSLWNTIWVYGVNVVGELLRLKL